jgi:hypothetical protein
MALPFFPVENRAEASVGLWIDREGLVFAARVARKPSVAAMRRIHRATARYFLAFHSVMNFAPMVESG